MANWSTDADLVAADPRVLECFPKERAELVRATDGATNAAGTGVSSATIGSGFLTALVAANHYLEVFVGEYQGFYRLGTVVAALATADRVIGASLTGLSIRVRTFDTEHSEAHQHYLDAILVKLGSSEDGGTDDEVFDESEIHARSLRALRDLCVARVLGRVFRAAAPSKDSVYWSLADKWEFIEKGLIVGLDKIEMDTDADTDVDEEQVLGWGSVEARIS